MIRTIVSVFVLTTILISASIDSYQFISPKPGSKYNTRESSIIIRWGEEIAASAISENLITVNGSVSGDVNGDLIISRDQKTIIFKPYQKFAYNEMVTVSLKKDMRTISGIALPEKTFTFEVTGKLPVIEKEALNDEDNYKYMPGRIPANLTPIAADTVPNNFPPIEVNI